MSKNLSKEDIKRVMTENDLSERYKFDIAYKEGKISLEVYEKVANYWDESYNKRYNN